MTQSTNQGSADDLVRALRDAIRTFAGDGSNVLQPEQKRRILQFRAVRNANGNYGLRGETRDDAIFTPPEILTSGNILRFLEPALPSTVVQIVLRYATNDGSRQSEKIRDVGDVDPETWEITIDDPAVLSIEVLDQVGEPLKLAVPKIVSQLTKQNHTTTVTGGVQPSISSRGTSTPPKPGSTSTPA